VDLQRTRAARPALTAALETARLRLRRFRDGDLDAYARITSDAETMRHLAAGAPFSRDEALRSLGYIHGHWQIRGYGLWAVGGEATGALVGRIGLRRPDGWPGLEVAWLIARERWREGLATEGARAALAHALRSVRRAPRGQPDRARQRGVDPRRREARACASPSSARSPADPRRSYAVGASRLIARPARRPTPSSSTGIGDRNARPQSSSSASHAPSPTRSANSMRSLRQCRRYASNRLSGCCDAAKPCASSRIARLSDGRARRARAMPRARGASRRADDP
jgi:RimJ/RimL family protein N-acetyltransferase